MIAQVYQYLDKHIHLLLFRFTCPAILHNKDKITKTPFTMQPIIKLPPDTSTVSYESKEEKDDSELQLVWQKVMEEGNYKDSTIYTKVEVLILCWAEELADMNTKGEVDRLRSTFEQRFNYNTQVEYLDTSVDRRLQVRVNAIMASFVCDHDGPNTLLIVYYAGHGRPANNFGGLELSG